MVDLLGQPRGQRCDLALDLVPNVERDAPGNKGTQKHDRDHAEQRQRQNGASDLGDLYGRHDDIVQTGDLVDHEVHQERTVFAGVRGQSGDQFPRVAAFHICGIEIEHSLSRIPLYVPIDLRRHDPLQVCVDDLQQHDPHSDEEDQQQWPDRILDVGPGRERIGHLVGERKRQLRGPEAQQKADDHQCPGQPRPEDHGEVIAPDACAFRLFGSHKHTAFLIPSVFATKYPDPGKRPGRPASSAGK